MWLQVLARICTVVTATAVYGGIFAAAAPAANRAIDFRCDAELVLIPLSVTDHVGHAILGLGVRDFIVAEDGAAQNVRAVSSWDAPASIGVVFDSSGSMKNSMRIAEDAVRALFREADENDEAFLIQFADSPRLEVDFTKDVNQLQGKLLWTAPHGATALFDAVYAGVDRMRLAANAHKALVVVTDGGDNHSRRSFGELLRAARESDVQIFVLAIRRDIRDQDEQRGRVQLNEVANDTGGLLIVVDSDAALEPAMERVRRLIRNQYLIEYRPSNLSRDGKWHRVRVRLSAERTPAFRIHSKTGYHAPEN